jgi:hypothetical protein
MIQQKEHKLFFTRGWSQLRDFYDIHSGAWITLVYLPIHRFVIHIRDRFGKDITVPIYDPPYKSSLYPDGFQTNINVGFGKFPYFRNLTFLGHQEQNFKYSYVKHLTADDVSSSFLVFSDDIFPFCFLYIIL